MIDRSGTARWVALTLFLPASAAGLVACNRGDDGLRAVLIVQADRGPVTLVSAIGYGEDPPAMVVVNERTTVATGNAFAQFINGRRVVGNAVGMLNAVRMAGNLAHPVTGDAGLVVSRTPNGGENSTFATFNSLANAVAACVAKDLACVDLFNAGRPHGGAAAGNVLQAVANIVKYPSYAGYPVDEIDSRAPATAPSSSRHGERTRRTRRFSMAA